MILTIRDNNLSIKERAADMDTLRDAWNRDYSVRGRRWAGLSERLPPVSGSDRVLEIGCGDGKTLVALAGTGRSPPGNDGEGPEIVGLDFSMAALRLCSHAAGGYANITLVCADGSSLPFADSSFDTVLLIHVLGHALYPSRVLICQEAGRVVRTKGLIIIRVFSANDFRAGKGEEIEERTYLRGDGTFTHYFHKDEISSFNPLLSVLSIETCSWNLKIRGTTYPREEFHAILRKDNS